MDNSTENRNCCKCGREIKSGLCDICYDKCEVCGDTKKSTDQMCNWCLKQYTQPYLNNLVKKQKKILPPLFAHKRPIQMGVVYLDEQP